MTSAMKEKAGSMIRRYGGGAVREVLSEEVTEVSCELGPEVYPQVKRSWWWVRESSKCKRPGENTLDKLKGLN